MEESNQFPRLKKKLPEIMAENYSKFLFAKWSNAFGGKEFCDRK